MPEPTPAERERSLRKHRKKIVGPALTIDTDLPESIHSDEPDPPSSPLLKTTGHSFQLEVAFPSIFRPVKLLRGMRLPEQLQQMRSLVPCMHDELPDPDTNAVYERTRCAIICTGDMLVERVKSIATDDPGHTTKAMAEVLEFMELALSGMGLLLQTAETIRSETKPLPALPEDNAEESWSPDITEPLAELIADVLRDPDSCSSSPIEENKATPPVSPGSDATLASSDATLVSSESPMDAIPERPSSPPTLKGERAKLIRRLLVLAPSASSSKPQKALLSLRTAPDASSLNSSTPTLLRASRHPGLLPEPPLENPYVVRQSFIYHRADPLCPGEDVDMPLPIGPSVAIRLDSNGELKAASLPALIRLLTSAHAPLEHDLLPTFFLCFRFFSTPCKVLAALQARWDEPPPTSDEPLIPAQQRVWLHNALTMRIRVAHLLLVWLDEYWRPAQDAAVLPSLRAFAEYRLASGGVPASLAQRVLAGIECAAADQHGVRRHLAWETAGRADRHRTLLQAPFAIVLRAEDDYAMNLTVFETAPGRERLAAQITARAAGLFSKIDPEEWYASGVLEETTLFWVAQSILVLQSREERAAMIEFWLDMATICVRLRNFSSASAIFGGLVYSPVERLSLTILDIAIPSKEQYRKLNEMFAATNNFANYRRALSRMTYPPSP
ncbi:ras guanine nucleotide exchange factor domain-containing protein [Mycena sp. CBHHK59/15]|nr:ras guanine nucleotide exchange factor domain-containing protein [Mycena sp. CBHHK59/15]